MVVLSNIPVGAEGEGIDGISMVQGVEVLAIIEIPQHGLGILAAGSAEGTIRGHGDGVQVASVTNVVGLQLAVGQVPDLDKLVPSATDDERNRLGRRESDARDPFGVSSALGVVSADGVLAFSEGVPETDGSVTGSYGGK